MNSWARDVNNLPRQTMNVLKEIMRNCESSVQFFYKPKIGLNKKSNFYKTISLIERIKLMHRQFRCTIENKLLKNLVWGN